MTAPVSPAARTAWFTEARLGMFIHFGLSAIAARDLSWPMSWERLPDAQWSRFAAEFNPDKGGPADWVRLAKRAGLRYAVLTVKHHEGFCLFDSALTDYKSTNTPCGRDLAREFVEACRAEGIRPGFYYSLLDWHHPDYPARDPLHPERDDPASLARPREWSRYVDYLHGQIRELLTNYGDISLLWMDYSYGEMSGEKWRAEALHALVRQLQPNCMMNNRLVAGHENPGQKAKYGDFATPERAIPAGPILTEAGAETVWEACLTISEAWGYSRVDKNFKSPAQIIQAAIECVAKGGNMLLNIGPDARGRLQPEVTRVLTELGDWLDLNGEAIYGATLARLPDGTVRPTPPWGFWTQRGQELYGHLLRRPVGPINLPGLEGQITQARWVADGAEARLGRSWNSAGGASDAFLKWDDNALPDPRATVLRLRLKDAG